MQSFNCIRIGDANVLAGAVAQPCPSTDDPRTAIWAYVAAMLYPAGVPLFILACMLKSRLPSLAKRKFNTALLQELLLRARAADVSGKETFEDVEDDKLDLLCAFEYAMLSKLISPLHSASWHARAQL